jgi:hypothetical protein
LAAKISNRIFIWSNFPLYVSILLFLAAKTIRISTAIGARGFGITILFISKLVILTKEESLRHEQLDEIPHSSE